MDLFLLHWPGYDLGGSSYGVLIRPLAEPVFVCAVSVSSYELALNTVEERTSVGNDSKIQLLLSIGQVGIGRSRRLYTSRWSANGLAIIASGRGSP